MVELKHQRSKSILANYRKEHFINYSLFFENQSNVLFVHI